MEIKSPSYYKRFKMSIFGLILISLFLGFFIFLEIIFFFVAGITDIITYLFIVLLWVFIDLLLIFVIIIFILMARLSYIQSQDEDADRLDSWITQQIVKDRKKRKLEITRKRRKFT